jgi:uncharacterized membrane protein
MILTATNFWMCFAGVVYLFAGVFLLRREVSANRDWDKFISLAPVFIAAPLAAFAPENFHGPAYIQQVVPQWMPVRVYWPYFIGCALLAAATSLTVRKCIRWSATLLGMMFLLFVCLVYMPAALAHPENRLGWAYVLRDLSFAAGSCALAGLHWRVSFPSQSAWFIQKARIVLAIAAIYFALQHFCYPGFAPGVPSEKLTPSWVPFPHFWSYLSGAVLLAGGIGLSLNKGSRVAAASIGALMTALTLLLYMTLLIMPGSSSIEFNDAINDVADTLLYGGVALALASALPTYSDRVEKT